MVKYMLARMDTLGIEPRASRMLSGCDTTTPCALGRSLTMSMGMCILACGGVEVGRATAEHLLNKAIWALLLEGHVV